MSTFRNYSDPYRPRSCISSSNYGRSTPTGSSLGSYKTNYTSSLDSSLRKSAAKDKTTRTSLGSSYSKWEGDNNDKSGYRYSFLTNGDKDRPHSGLTQEEIRPRSRSCTSGSLMDKYSLSGKTVERPLSMFEKYNRGSHHDTIREPEFGSRFGYNRHSESSLSNCYSEGRYSEKKDKSDHPLISYRGLRPTASRTGTREINSELGNTKNAAYDMYSRTQASLGRNSASSNASESSSAPIAARFGPSVRYSPRINPERINPAISYSGSDRFTSSNKIPSTSYTKETVKTPTTNHESSNGISNKPISKTTGAVEEPEDDKSEFVTISITTRGTSPISRLETTGIKKCADSSIANMLQTDVLKRRHRKVETCEKELQCDQPEKQSANVSKSETSSRISSAPWIAPYIDKFDSPSEQSTTSISSKTLPSRRFNSFGFPKSSETSCTLKEDSTRSSPSCAQDTEPPSSSSIASSVLEANDSSSAKEDETSKTDKSNRRRPSLNRVVRTSPKTEISCKPKLQKKDGQDDRRKTISKSSGSSTSSRNETLRIVEGQDRNPKESSVSPSTSLSNSENSSSHSKSVHKNDSSKNSRHLTRSESSEGFTGSLPANRSKASPTSSSASAMTNQSAKIKTATSSSSSPLSQSSKQANSATSTSVNLKQASSSDGRGKPPVPKSEMIGKSTPGTMKYVNKDFRKSALNMENGDPARSQMLDRKRLKKTQRSMSLSSQDSQSEGHSEAMQQVPSSGSSAAVVSSRSSSKLKTPSSSLSKVPKNKIVPKNLPVSETQSSRKLKSKSPSVEITRCASEASSLDESSKSISSNFSNSGTEDDKSNRDKKRPPSSAGKSVKSNIGSIRTGTSGNSSSSSVKSERAGKTDEAKSFLMRALAPVTNLFKIKHQDSSEIKGDGWETSNDENSENSNGLIQFNSKSPTQKTFPNSEFTSDTKKSLQKLGHQSSEEKPWWLDSNSENIPDGVERTAVDDDISQDTTISMPLPDDGKFKFKIWRQDSEEKAWWLDDNDKQSLRGSKSDSIPLSSLSRKNSSREEKSSRSDKKNRISHQRSGERAWWLSNDPESVPDGVQIIPTSPSANQTSEPSKSGEGKTRMPIRIRHIESGEKAWWMDSSANVPEGVKKIPTETSSATSDSSESFDEVNINDHSKAAEPRRDVPKFPINLPPSPDEPLGDRASPEGIENPPEPPDSYEGRTSPYENVPPTIRPHPNKRSPPRKRPPNLPLFIGDHKNIDDFLGDLSMELSPVMSRVQKGKDVDEDLSDSEECEEIDATQVIIHDSTPKTPVIQRRIRDSKRFQPEGYIPLDDTALQLYKDGDYGAYLDLEASISEQQEEFEGFQTSRKNSIVLRTQLSVRVHTIIEKLLNSEGRELRRALFSLKQIFQEDKDLVHEFVQNDGLACLIKVGNEADQNYQNYILRALGQVMLYVDGMNGVMEHGQTVQWLYTLIASRFRLVVKTALKLLLVFVEYVETNSLLLVRAIRSVDTSRGMIPWTNVMKLLKDYDASDTELLIYATTLVNKCLNGIPDQDTYYDQVDCLEEQGIEGIIQRYMSKQGTDLDLLRQFQIYEAVLHHEDGNERSSPMRQLDDNIRKTLRNRKSLVDSHERRKSRRHSTGTSPLSMSLNVRLSPRLNHSLGLNSMNTLNSTLNSSIPDDDDESSSSQSSQGLGEVQLNGSYKDNKVDVGVTPALRRRRERAERQRSFIREQQEATANMRASVGHPDDQESSFNGLRYTNGSSAYDRNTDSTSNKLSRVNSRKDLTPLLNAANKLDSEEKKPWYGKSPDEGVECDEGNHTDDDDDRRVVLQLKREGTVKDLTQKLTAQNLIPSSPFEDKVSRIGDMSGLISKAKEGLAKSKSKADVLKSPTGDNLPKIAEVKKSENELHWEELVNKLKRPLCLCDLDFTDLNSDDEIDVLGPVNKTNGVPPPPPPMAPGSAGSAVRAPPPPAPPPGGCRAPPPPMFGVNLRSTRPPLSATSPTTTESGSPKSPPPAATKKSKKTVKLFWKEVRDDPIILSRLDNQRMIWDELSSIPVDTQKLEHLFESRAKDLITKKQQEMNKNKEIIVLDHKRSNAINIGMTKLPPPRSIKTAILKMDATIMNREGIEKLLTMLPTEEERSRIQEAQAANPDLPLGSAEQFLLTLASISELPARLKLWAFKLDFENSEKEIADPLMDLKQGMETLRVNKTFRGILSTLLSIGIFLNGNEVKGFQLEYLAKVPEVKDTVHKHSLLHHLCHMVMEKFPDSTDLYSEIGAITRASKIDFDELAANIGKLENDCKASWDHLKLIAKHDGSIMMKVKMSDFLADCAERIIVLCIVHRRIINRFHKFVLWLGIPLHRVQDTKPNEFCRIVSEFSLEYRTTRERVIQQLEKKANHRERNKTRGKMITEVGKFRTKEDRADAELRQLLGSDISDVESIHGTLPWRRQRRDGRTPLGPLIRDESGNGNLTDGDDELLESLVKTATKVPATRTTPRERKRTRHADRKSLKRSRTRENNTTAEGYRP